MNYEWLGRASRVNTQIGLATSILACLFLVGASSSLAQPKPQWMPGQVGLNAGILPSPGFTYVNLDENYDAGAFNGPKGKVPRFIEERLLRPVETEKNFKIAVGICGNPVRFLSSRSLRPRVNIDGTVSVLLQSRCLRGTTGPLHVTSKSVRVAVIGCG